MSGERRQIGTKDVLPAGTSAGEVRVAQRSGAATFAGQTATPNLVEVAVAEAADSERFERDYDYFLKNHEGMDSSPRAA